MCKEIIATLFTAWRTLLNRSGFRFGDGSRTTCETLAKLDALRVVLRTAPPYGRTMAAPDDDRAGRRRRTVIAAAGVAVAVVAVAAALFQPWKLWIDDEVDEAVPAGAVAIAAPTTSVTTPSTATPTTTMPATTVPAAPVAPTTVAPSTVAPTTVQPVPVGGQFVSRDHGTSGAAVLLQDPTGALFVRLESLDTTNGPDLFVYLSTNPPDGPEGQFDDDVVSLGRLEGNIGSSNYLIPPGTDLSRFASVVIWCDRFDSAFGAAPLG